VIFDSRGGSAVFREDIRHCRRDRRNDSLRLVTVTIPHIEGDRSSEINNDDRRASNVPCRNRVRMTGQSDGFRLG